MILVLTMLGPNVFANYQPQSVESEITNFVSGGFVVVIEGFTDKDIELEFPSQKEGLVQFAILNMKGELVYSNVVNTTNINLSDLQLPAGHYRLVVKVGTTVKEVMAKL